MPALSDEDMALALRMYAVGREIVDVLERHFDEDIASALTALLDVQGAMGATGVAAGLWTAEEFRADVDTALRSLLDEPKG